MFKFFDRKLRRKTGGFTLIELVVVLAILGILLALAVPRYLGARKRAYKAEIDNILQEMKTLSWAYYQEHNEFPSTVANIGFSMPAGAAWDEPDLLAGTGSDESSVRWDASGLAGGAPVEVADTCSIILNTNGSSSQGCNF